MSARQRFRMNTTIGGSAAVALASAAFVSCETPPQAVMKEPAPVRVAAPAEFEPASDLAMLAQRDVESFLNRRRETPEADAAHALSAGPPDILWNQPAPRRATPPRPAPAKTIDDAATPTVLASDGRSLDPVKAHDANEGVPERTALDAAFRGRLRELLVDLSKELYQEASYADMPLRELLLIAATTLVSPDRALVPDAIPGLTDRERELLAHFQSFFIELGTKLDGSRNADEVLISELESLRESLSTEPRLELGALALCTRVGGFGDYSPFPKYAFLAHAEQQAIVYIEIAGFASELNPKGEWVTQLSQQLVIYSERDGIPVWREDWQTAVDVSRNRRNDFFVVQIITLPKALSVGKYHLKVRVRDEKSRAESEGAITFEMVADPRMATGG